MITAEMICVMAGLVIAPAVSFFKRWTLVASHPKLFAFGLSILTAAVSGLSLGDLDWMAVTTCVLVPFATAVATYEVVIKPVVTQGDGVP